MTTRRTVFFSFHHGPDNRRAAQIRDMGLVDGNSPISDSEWEAVTHGGDNTIKEWIKHQMSGASCVIVLIGSDTEGRKWIEYEIEEAWGAGKGVLGIHIHNLKDEAGNQSEIGDNPFSKFAVASPYYKDRGKEAKLSDFVQTYDPPYKVSAHVYAYIQANIANWVEEAIRIRSEH